MDKPNTDQLHSLINEASDMLFDSMPLDAEHNIRCHLDDIPAAYLKLAKAAKAAFDILAKASPEIG